MDTNLPDGVYIGLDFETYLAQEGRHGSSDKTKLYHHGPGYWWASPMNPYYRRAQSPDMLEGEALHALLLEGLSAYESRFCVEPDTTAYSDVLFTIPQIKDALAEAGLVIKGSSAFRLEDWAEQAAMHLPNRTVWHNVMADFHAARGSRKPLSAEADFQLRAMHEAAMDNHPDNDDVRELLNVGHEFPILAEVSILYTDATGRHRARPDKLIPTATVDLKSVGAWAGRPLVHMVGDLINRNGYDIQEADYQIARREGFRMILEDEDNLHGGTQEERAHVLAMALWDRTHEPNWGWLFFGKPENTGRAPVLFPVLDRWGGPYHRSGFRKRAQAMATYHECMERFGPNRPWSKVMPLHFTSEADEPHITLSHFGWAETPAEGEAEFFRDGHG